MIFPTESKKCGRCGLLIRNSAMVAGKCEEPGCQEILCKNCWQNQWERFCRPHSPYPKQKLQRANEKLKQGAIPLLVTAEAARELEFKFISRFNSKIREYNHLINPLNGYKIKIKSWEKIYQQNSEIKQEASRPAAVPLNITASYQWPVQKTGEISKSKASFVISAVTLHNLDDFRKNGFSVNPVPQNIFHDFLEGKIEVSRLFHTFQIIGLASSTGWCENTQKELLGDDKYSSFTSTYLSICLIDLLNCKLIYNSLDERLGHYIPIFQGDLRREFINQLSNHMKIEMNSKGILSLKQVAKTHGCDFSLVLEAAHLLEATGEYEIDDLPDVGLVISL